MEQNDILHLFFSQEKEYLEFKKNRSNNTEFDKDGMLQYIKDVCAIPYGTFIDYIRVHPHSQMIDSLDLTQSSNIIHCKAELCEAFLRSNDRGLTLTEIGALLHNDDKERTQNTLNRFGRDQTYTGRQLGLTRLFSNGKWYLSAIGKVFLLLDENTQNAIIARCLLRDPLYHRLVVDMLEEDIQLTDYMIDLDSESTIKRRKSSIKGVLKIIFNEVNKECPNKIHTAK